MNYKKVKNIQLETKIQRLPFELPAFVRTAWTSEAARSTWENRISRVSAACSDLQWRSVQHGLRPCALVSESSDQYAKKACKWLERGLLSLPLATEAQTSTYSSKTQKYKEGHPSSFRIAIGNPENLKNFEHAWREGNNIEIGQLLGYPKCCLSFFEKYWVQERYLDTTWPMALGTSGIMISDERTVSLKIPPETNILWRWLGIRMLPFLPCSFECEESIKQANAFVKLGKDCGYQEEMEWLQEVLSWPLEWSALHGIGELKTPILKMLVQTDATPVKYIVQGLGEVYPKEGASGVNFPYTKKQKLSVKTKYITA